MKPDPEWLPMAWLMPACLVLWAVAVIEGACDAWPDEDEMEEAG